MRIISGKYKGKRLLAPKKLPVRPTTDMAKEALFNILGNRYYFEEIKVLDLFAGTGNISFEFASRSCENITAVDANVGCVKYINRISNELQFNIKTLKMDAFHFLNRNTERFDIIFADPPYDFDFNEFKRLPELVFEKNQLLEEGILAVEHSPQTDLSEIPNFKEARKYGSSVFSFFEN